LLCGCRPGEIVALRGRDIDRSDADVWVAVPQRHKLQHFGRQVRIYFGPRAREVLTPFLRFNAEEYLFDPREAQAERNRRVAQQRTGLAPAPKRTRETVRTTTREVGFHYTTVSYGRAIARACRVAGVEPWSPHGLRHAAEARFEREFGIEVARCMLSHTTISTTALYGERDHRAARAAAARCS
jgi:integrase